MPTARTGNSPLTPGFALVTGASSGIGACFARKLGERNRDLVLVARSRAKLQALADEISTRQARRVEVIEQDLSAPGAALHLAALLNERGIAIDLLVNNAGFGMHGQFWRLPLDRQSEMMRLNMVTLTELTYLLLPGMVERRSGGIINISSTASFQAMPYMCVYAATKAYVTSFSTGLAEEVAEYGVKVVALCPGATASNFFAAGQFGEVNWPGGLQSPEEVVEAGLRAFERGNSLATTRFLHRLMLFAQRFAPRRFVTRQAGNLTRKGLPGGK